jgi:hypothetical protein
MDYIENAASNSSSIVACISTAADMRLSSCCLAMVISSSSSIPPFRCHVTIFFLVRHLTTISASKLYSTGMCNILTNTHTPLADNNFSNERGKTQAIVTEDYSQSTGYVDKEDGMVYHSITC